MLAAPSYETQPPMTPLAFLVACAFFMEFLDGTIITTALPRMALSLNTDPVDLHVGITAYLLTVAVFILPGGWAADRWGARRVFSAAIATFTLGSALCALADSVPTFVAARIVQGLGGAMMVPVGRLTVLRTTEKSGLLRAITILTWPGLSAPLLGPPLGGFIAEHASWRYIFIVNIPLGIIGYIAALRLVPTMRDASRKPFDISGFTLGAILLAAATSALDLLGHDHPPLPTVAALAVLATATATILLRHIHRHPHPLPDPAPFRTTTFRLTITTGTAMRILISAMPFLVPLMFQLGFGLDPFQAGLLVLALFAGNFGIKPLTSPIIRRFGFRTTIVANGLLQAATMLACAGLTPATPLPAIIALLALSGASRSLQFTSLNSLAFADVPQPSIASANTLFSVAFQLGIGLGVAVGAILLRAATVALGRAGPPTAAAFSGAFVILAVLMVFAALAGLRFAPDAGAVVSGHPAAAK